MENARHVVVRAFERLVLFPLDICILVTGVVLIIDKSWLFGAFLLLMSYFLGIVGQALPHNKKLTARRLCSQNTRERCGDITHEESLGLANATLLPSFHLRLAAGA